MAIKTLIWLRYVICLGIVVDTSVCPVLVRKKKITSVCTRVTSLYDKDFPYHLISCNHLLERSYEDLKCFLVHWNSIEYTKRTEILKGCLPIKRR